MTFSELKVGQKVAANFMLPVEWARIEFVAVDWAVARDERGAPLFIDADDVKYLKPWSGE